MMKSKREISDLIRDNQHQLDERPSSRVWEKLEGKLDNHENKKRTFIYRRLALAAAVVALVAVVSLLTVVNQKQDSKMAVNEAPSSSWVAQDLETIETDTDQNVQQVIEFQRALKERYANPIKEGKETKKLLASNQQLTNTTTPTSSPTDSRELIAMNDAPKKFDKKEKNNLSTELAGNTSTDAVTEEMEAEYFEEDAIVSLDSKNASSADVVVSSPKMEKITTAEKPASPKMSKKRSSNTALPTKDISPTNIQNYKWLAGTWEENGAKLELQFLNQADLISDDFQIKQLGNELFFIAKTSTQSTYVFKGNNLSAEQAGNNLTTFENQKKEKVVLEKIDEFSFSITYISKKGEKDKIKIYKKW